jgi:hypothetical protein
MRRAVSVGAALAWVGLIVACGRGASNTPGAVADRFLDLYLIEIDQARALPLTTGPARQRIEEELEAVKAIRGAGYTPSAAKPAVYYERASLLREPAAGTARAVYDIRIRQGDTESRRHVLLSLHNRDAGQWKVASFVVQEGPAAGR